MIFINKFFTDDRLIPNVISSRLPYVGILKIQAIRRLARLTGRADTSLLNPKHIINDIIN